MGREASLGFDFEDHAASRATALKVVF